MKIDEAMDTLAKFFNDLIGAWVPGAVLALGLAVMHLGPSHLQMISKLGDSSGTALTIAGLLFALGHTLLAVYDHGIKSLLKKTKILKGFDEVKLKKRQPYVWFSKWVEAQQVGSLVQDWSYNDLRSVALSVSAEAASLGRRFMFISLLCNGVGTALSIIGFDYVACIIFYPKLLYPYEQVAPWPVQAVLLFVIAWILFKQGEVFYSRAMATPFTVAIAEMNFKKESNVSNTSI
ncbi:hypothetical protein [Aeromonas media]|uniref:hypothetical protein n=1 Tax=Aeromonas media TaxID=651 RepID=UPI003D06DDC6